MNNNQWLIDAIKGDPNSLTSTAFHTGQVLERQRIIKLLETDCKNASIEFAIALIKGDNQ